MKSRKKKKREKKAVSGRAIHFATNTGLAHDVTDTTARHNMAALTAVFPRFRNIDLNKPLNRLKHCCESAVTAGVPRGHCRDQGHDGSETG